ncbi:MAG TPA: glycosyltransferase [Vicinamibacteria bacterium]
MGGPIAYIMSRFPHLPETFILREMSELERQGCAVHLYPLVRQRQRVVHSEARAWMERAVSLSLARAMVALLRAVIASPVKLARTWLRVVWENHASFRFFARSLVVFPKAVLAAERMRRDGVGHIHAHYATHPALAAWIIHRLTGITYSMTTHAHDIFVDRAMLRTKVADASFVITISDFNRDFLHRHVGEGTRSKLRVVRCGIDPDRYRPAVRPASPERFQMLTIASLQPYKGLRYLVEACKELHDRGIDFRSRIVGEGEERKFLESLIADLGLDGRVEILGGLPQETIERLLPEADCYVQPSVVTPSGKMEGIPVSIMEALACEVPVVASAISGIPELVEHGVTGSLVPPADSRALALALLDVVRDPERFRRRARAGRLRVLKEYRLERNVAEIARLFSTFGGPDRGSRQSLRPAS